MLVVFVVGVAFSEGMADDGYEEVVSIDISSVVIQAMQEKHSNRQDLKCGYFVVGNLDVFGWILCLLILMWGCLVCCC